MVLYFARYFVSQNRYPKKMLTANVATDYKKIANIFSIGGDETTALQHLNKLLEKGTVKSYLVEKFNVELGFGITEIWSMLFYMGMTTVTASLGNDWTFQMPNYVIKSLYYDYFVALQLGTAYGNLRDEIRDSIHQLVMHGQIQRFSEHVGDALQRAHSCRDNYGYNEKHLKTLVIGLLYPYESYLIRSEIESEKTFLDIFLERIPQVNIKYEIVIELKYIKKENATKWADADGKPVDPPAAATPAPKTKGRKKKSDSNNTLTPTPVVFTGVKPLLDDVIERGKEQLAKYMVLPRYNRPDVFGFCLVYVGDECKHVWTHPK
jgi:hypothetical protein